MAMVSQLLADGTGPLYREACRDDLADIIEKAARTLMMSAGIRPAADRPDQL